MRTNVKQVVILLAGMILLAGCNKNGPLEAVEIPDNAFLDALIQQGVDRNGDGEICFCEAGQVKRLDVASLEISSLLGIEAFVNLETLICAGNLLTSLNISGNTALDSLFCQGNQLVTLDLSHNSALEVLSLSGMPTLGEVCVWTTPFPPEGVTADTTGSHHLYFSTGCAR